MNNLWILPWFNHHVMNCWYSLEASDVFDTDEDGGASELERLDRVYKRDAMALIQYVLQNHEELLAKLKD